jgi:hypothetical protein
MFSWWVNMTRGHKCRLLAGLLLLPTKCIWASSDIELYTGFSPSEDASPVAPLLFPYTTIRVVNTSDHDGYATNAWGIPFTPDCYYDIQTYPYFAPALLGDIHVSWEAKPSPISGVLPGIVAATEVAHCNSCGTLTTFCSRTTLFGSR